MYTAKGKEIDGKWIDENFMNIPPDLSNEIKKTIREYWKKYHDSDYLLLEQKKTLDKWMLMCDLDDDAEDELV